ASSDSGRAPGNSEVSMIEFDKFAVSWERGICFKYSRVEKAAADDWESSSSHRLLGGSGRLSYRNGAIDRPEAWAFPAQRLLTALTALLGGACQQLLLSINQQLQ
ncbi:UHRF1-binding protein 1, partial [Dissostichus eleginoides]